LIVCEAGWRAEKRATSSLIPLQGLYFLPPFLLALAAFTSVLPDVPLSAAGLLGVFFFMAIDPQKKRTIDPPDSNLCATGRLDKRIFSLLGIEKID
jgi:hypothetical protein